MKKKLLIGFLCLCLLLFSGCGEKAEEAAKVNPSIYYLNAEASKLVAQEHIMKASDSNGKIEEIFQAIATETETAKESALLPEGVNMNSWEVKDNALWIDFSASYAGMEPTREILVRAGIVRAFGSLGIVGNVGFLIEGQELTDVRGQAVGLMKADDFVENSGKEVNAYQYVTMKLYFANRTGDKLVLEERQIYYSKNIPLERAVVEQLLEGPRAEGNYPTIPVETKILSASAMDGLGYVNFDQAFMNPSVTVNGDVAVQSVVRSIAEACNVEKVQISINGETKVDFRGNISLDQFFEVDNSLAEGTG